MAKKVYNTSNETRYFNGKPTVQVFRKENKNLEDITDDVVINTTVHLRDFISFSEFYAIFEVRKSSIFAEYNVNNEDSWNFLHILDKLDGVWTYDDPHFSDWWIDQLIDKLGYNVYNVLWQRVLKTDGDKEAYKQADKAFEDIQRRFK